MADETPAQDLFFEVLIPLGFRGRWVCAVAKQLNGEGFLITAYLTDAMKEGTRVWSK